MDQSSLRILIFLWQLGLVDTYTVLTNLCTKWGGIIIGNAGVSRNVTMIARVLEPISQLGTVYKYLKSAETKKELLTYGAQVLSVFFMSGTVLTMTPTANLTQAGLVIALMSHMSETLDKKRSLQLAIARATLDAVGNNVTRFRGGGAPTPAGSLSLMEDLSPFSYNYDLWSVYSHFSNYFYQQQQSYMSVSSANFDVTMYLHQKNMLKYHAQIDSSAYFYGSPDLIISNTPYVYKKSIFDINWRPKRRPSAESLEMDRWLNEPYICESSNSQYMTFTEFLNANKLKICGVIVIGGTLYFCYKKSTRFKKICDRTINTYKSIKNHRLINNPISSRILIFTHAVVFVRPL